MGALQPSLLEILLGGQIYLKLVWGGHWGLYSLHYWKPSLGTNLLEVSIGRDLGAVKKLTPKSSKHNVLVFASLFAVYNTLATMGLAIGDCT